MAFRLGLIEAPFARALHITRRIRNSFAHEVQGRSLEAPPYSDQVRELAAPFERSKVFTNFREVLPSPREHGFSSKTFRICVSMMAARLISGSHRITRVREQNCRLWQDE
jgi:hypothetical protein